MNNRWENIGKQTASFSRTRGREARKEVIPKKKKTNTMFHQETHHKLSTDIGPTKFQHAAYLVNAISVSAFVLILKA